MQRISFDRHRFPPEIIRHADWLYARFTLSYRDVAACTSFDLQRHLVDRAKFKRDRAVAFEAWANAACTA